REIIPAIAPPLPFEEAVLASVGEKLIPWELERDNTIMSSLRGNDETITIIIGPEGGLEHDEVGVAFKNGFTPVTLGPRILRAELAPVVALAQILAFIEKKK
ncbi:MAG: RNA methyltransferase, partial [Caldisericia bacterium]|nr:RNA methyltransferase [Caldisericia bacterium]